MLELDLLLLKFFDEHFSDLSLKDQGTFEQLLEAPDPVLQEYLYGLAAPNDAELRAMVMKIRDC